MGFSFVEFCPKIVPWVTPGLHLEKKFKEAAGMILNSIVSNKTSQ
jgi:hypothetical protein